LAYYTQRKYDGEEKERRRDGEKEELGKTTSSGGGEDRKEMEGQRRSFSS